MLVFSITVTYKVFVSLESFKSDKLIRKVPLDPCWSAMTSVPINLANKFNSSRARSDEPVGSELADIKSEAEGDILTLGNNFSSTSGVTSSDSSAQLEILGLFHSLQASSSDLIVIESGFSCHF